jgi:hypothetical protein
MKNCKTQAGSDKSGLSLQKLELEYITILSIVNPTSDKLRNYLFMLDNFVYIIKSLKKLIA